jgi:hypothetical protein
VNFPAEADSLTTPFAKHSPGAIARKVFGREVHNDGLPLEELFVHESGIGLG